MAASVPSWMTSAWPISSWRGCALMDAPGRCRAGSGWRGAVVQHGRVHHVLQLVLVLGVHVHEVGDAAQIADVEEAVVGGAVVAAQAAAIHAEDDGQVLERDVVHDGIERSLQEGRVDRAEGLVSLGGEAGGEEHRVLLGDADVEVARGVPGAEEVECRSVRHRRGDGDDLVIAVGKLGQALRKQTSL